MDDPSFRGSCACGRITYKCSSKPIACAACHCVTCRKQSGAAFQAFAAIKADTIVFHDRKDDITIGSLPETSKCGIEVLARSNIAERFFCADCHTPFGMRYKHRNDAHSITLGSVDEETIRDAEVKKALEPEVHIFCTQMTWWCKGVAKDERPHFERFTGTFEDDIKAWEAKTS